MICIKLHYWADDACWVMQFVPALNGRRQMREHRAFFKAQGMLCIVTVGVFKAPAIHRRTA